MTPDFTFNEKTGELERGGKLLPLCRLHADLFACLKDAQGPISAEAMGRAVDLPAHAIFRELPALRSRLLKLNMRLASQRGGRSGYWLVLEEMPTWQSKIRPPAEVPFQ